MNKFKTSELIGKASRILNNTLSNSLSKSGLEITSEQWIILEILQDGPKTQKELCDITMKNKASVNSLINYLIKQKYITKTNSSKDKRSSSICITASGRKVKGDANSIASGVISTGLKDLSHEEIIELNIYLKRIISNLIPK